MQKILVSVIPFSLLLALFLFAQTPDAAGPGDKAPFSAGGAAVVSASNLKVLTAQNVEFTMQNVEFTMQNITFALGVGCVYCHDLSNLALDTNPKKAKALMMLEIVRDINAKFDDGKTHVNMRITCHPIPESPLIS